MGPVRQISEIRNEAFASNKREKFGSIYKHALAPNSIIYSTPDVGKGWLNSGTAALQCKNVEKKLKTTNQGNKKHTKYNFSVLLHGFGRSLTCPHIPYRTRLT